MSEEKLIKTGKFFTFIEPHMLNTIFDRETHYFFDGKCWNENYENISTSDSELDELQRSSLKMRYMGMLNDISSVFYSSDIIAKKDFLIRVNTAIRLLELNID